MVAVEAGEIVAQSPDGAVGSAVGLNHRLDGILTRLGPLGPGMRGSTM